MEEELYSNICTVFLSTSEVTILHSDYKMCTENGPEKEFEPYGVWFIFFLPEVKCLAHHSFTPEGADLRTCSILL